MESLHILQELARSLHNPQLTSQQLGKIGEDYASEWLKTQQWDILARNWGNRFSELDIVALSQTGILSFIEVKTRRSGTYGSPQDALTARKRSALRQTARWWLHTHSNSIPYYAVRFDVIAIRVSVELIQPQLDLIENAFQ